MLHLRLAVLLTSVLAGCASVHTEIASSTDRAFVGRTFRKLCVSAPQDDLLARRAVEGALADELDQNAGVEVVQLGEILFPGREHTEEDVRSAVEDSGADAYLVVSPLQSWVDERHVPASVSSTWWDYGGRRRPGFGTTTTWVTGGYTVAQPNAVFEARLLEVPSGTTVWIASVRAEGAPGRSWADLHSAAAREAARRLAADGLLPPKADAAD
jgi:hypothetical protein